MSDFDMIRELRRNDERLRLTEVKEGPRTNFGSAFPASWPNNIPFFRTDLGWWAYYDGTRWLTAHEYVLDADAATTPANNSGPYEWQMRQDYNPYFTRVSATTIVAPTNNGTNFWTVRFRGLVLNRTTATTIHDFTTAADTASTYTLKDAVPTSSQTPADDNTVQVFVTQTLAPGALTIVSASVAYRLIIP